MVDFSNGLFISSVCSLCSKDTEWGEMPAIGEVYCKLYAGLLFGFQDGSEEDEEEKVGEWANAGMVVEREDEERMSLMSGVR